MPGPHRIAIAVGNEASREQLTSAIAEYTPHVPICINSARDSANDIASAQSAFVEVADRMGETRSLLQQLRNRQCATGIVVVAASESISPDDAIELHQLGVSAFLTDPTRQTDVLERLEKSLRAYKLQAAQLQRSADAIARLKGLSPRQRDVLDLVVLGLPNKQVAAKLRISVRTVEKHRSRLYETTGTYNLIELAKMHGYANAGDAALLGCSCDRGQWVD